MGVTDKSTSPAKLLLVDDKRENLVALEAILPSRFYDVLKATSGKQALEIVLREDITLVLLDVIMPGMDGYEVARYLKSSERTRVIPIIFITANVFEAPYVYRAYQFGAVDYLVKPLDTEMVRRKVAVFVELVQQRREIERQGELLREADRREHEARLTELREAGERAVEEATEATRLCQELLAVVSHDLRAPLDAVVLHARQLQELGPSCSHAEELTDAARAILRHAEGMTRLIDDLLDRGGLARRRGTGQDSGGQS
jgi:CheY-like chemotaxis protein